MKMKLHNLAPLDDAAVSQRIRELFGLYGSEPGEFIIDDRVYEIDPDFPDSIVTRWNSDEYDWMNILRIDHEGLEFTRIAGPSADVPGDQYTNLLPASKLDDIDEVEEFSSQI